MLLARADALDASLSDHRFYDDPIIAGKGGRLFRKSRCIRMQNGGLMYHPDIFTEASVR